MDDDAIRTLVIRLSRAHPSGGEVIERAAILAEGADFDAVVGWIIAHDGRPEAKAAPSAGRGLHGTRLTAAAGATGPPARYVLPAGALA
jgi:hypothetical protein